MQQAQRLLRELEAAYLAAGARFNAPETLRVEREYVTAAVSPRLDPVDRERVVADVRLAARAAIYTRGPREGIEQQHRVQAVLDAALQDALRALDTCGCARRRCDHEHRTLPPGLRQELRTQLLTVMRRLKRKYAHSGRVVGHEDWRMLPSLDTAPRTAARASKTLNRSRGTESQRRFWTALDKVGYAPQTHSARTLINNGQVFDLEVGAREARATVIGSQGRHYQVQVVFTGTTIAPRVTRVQPRCSCPFPKKWCKHAIATVTLALEQHHPEP